MKQIDVNELTPIQSKVLMAIRENPLFTIKELALYCQLGTTIIGEVIKELKEKGKIVHKGAKKGGYWEVKLQSVLKSVLEVC